mmetsp:Transcript_44358/g.117672  ORF Transcript_44358/g.117672 Transcript_44358/m.117672 type:complete len:216 (+) Transcript_44358:686-1333(+)
MESCFCSTMILTSRPRLYAHKSSLVRTSSVRTNIATQTRRRARPISSQILIKCCPSLLGKKRTSGPRFGHNERTPHKTTKTTARTQAPHVKTATGSWSGSHGAYLGNAATNSSRPVSAATRSFAKSVLSRAMALTEDQAFEVTRDPWLSTLPSTERRAPPTLDSVSERAPGKRLAKAKADASRARKQVSAVSCQARAQGELDMPRFWGRTSRCAS